MFNGGPNTADAQPFVEAARFVCALLGPAPLGMMILGSTGCCVAANATLGTLSRQTLDADRLDGVQIRFRSAELSMAFNQAIQGEVASVETDSPPVLGPGQGQWRVHFLPFVVAEDRGAALLFEDMTEHHLATEAFQAAEQRFRLLVDSAADGIVIHRAQILLYVNPEAVRLFGYRSADELVGRTLIDLVDVDYRPSFESRLDDVESGHGTGVFESAFVRRDGRAFPVECRTSRARVDEMGAGFLFFHDIAERRRLQARRENARRVDALARLSTAIGGELHGYAADLRRAVARIKSANSLANGGAAELSQLIDTMTTRANTFSLVTRQDSEPMVSATLEEILSRVCSSLAQATATIVPDRERSPTPLFSRELLVDVEPVSFALRGDPASIEAGLTVLAQAAMQSRVSDTPLCIRGARLPASESVARTTYRLSIAGGKLKNANSATAHSSPKSLPPAWTFGSWEQGRDLEVLGAFAALQSQGCWVEVQNCLGGGLWFDVELSLDPGRSVAPDLEESAETVLSRTELGYGQPLHPELDEVPPDTERSHGSGAHRIERAFAPILICDDEARLIALTAGLLREFGFDVLTVRTGAEAIRTVATNPVDVVVLDVNLPGENAQEILAGLRARSDVSVILSSGYTEEDIEPELLRDSTVKAFLAKPYGVETLVETIDRVRQEVQMSVASIDKGAAP